MTAKKSNCTGKRGRWVRIASQGDVGAARKVIQHQRVAVSSQQDSADARQVVTSQESFASLVHPGSTQFFPHTICGGLGHLLVHAAAQHVPGATVAKENRLMGVNLRSHPLLMVDPEGPTVYNDLLELFERCFMPFLAVASPLSPNSSTTLR